MKNKTENTIQWWGYLHINGAIQVRRYFGMLDIQEAQESNFVQKVHGPFLALNREDAIEILKTKL